MTRALIAERFERGRLRYERVRPEHADELAALMSEPLVLKTLRPGEDPPNAAEKRAILEDKVDHWHRHGFGLWVVRDPDSRKFIGRGGLQHTEIEGVSAVEAAWALMPHHWGRGLATELAETSVQVAFTGLHLKQIVAVTLPDNHASRRVMERSGFSYERDIEHYRLAQVLYARSRTTAGATARLLRTSRPPL